MSKNFSLFIILSFFFIYCCDNAYSGLIRDGEVEAVIKDLAQPLFAAANIDYDQVKVFVVNDSSVNAFVIDNHSIFIHLGLLKYSTKPYTLLAILAHEIAHISAGHVLQMSNTVDYFQSIEMTSYMIGLISSVVIGPQVSNAILLSGVTLSSRLFFNYSQELESIADSYALRYLDESGYGNSGMKEIFSYLKSIEYEKNIGEYFRTHPLSGKRMFTIRSYNVKNNIKPISKDKLMRFERILAKLDSFLAPFHTLSSNKNQDNKNNNTKYINAIINYRQGRVEDAITEVDLLIQESSCNDPFLYELKAEMLYKTGNLSETIKMYEESLRYLPEKNSYLVKLALSHSLLLCGKTEKAIFYLEQIIRSLGTNDASVWKYLSVAYKLNSNMAMYYFALTKKAFIEGELKKFTRYSELAIKTLPRDATHLLEIEDMKTAIS